MPSQYRCTEGDETATFDSRHAATQAGWTLVEISAKDRVKYHVLCPAHRPAWLKQALADRKDKA